MQHAIQVRLHGLREELTHVISTIERLTPDVEARSRSVASSEERSAALLETIEQADDEVFDAFCQKIGVSNIREYEDVQLRIAKEANDAMESFAAQQARVKHQ